MVCHGNTALDSGHFQYLAVAVGSLLPAERGDDVDEATVVLHATLGAASLLLFLLLLVNLETDKKIFNYFVVFFYSLGFLFEFFF